MMAFLFWQKIAETPWWFFLMFYGLFRIGLSATKPKTIAFNRLIYFPAFYLTLIIICMFSTFEYSLMNTVYWLDAVVIGLMLGWLQSYSRGIKAIKNSNELYFPGSWILFGLIIAMFCAKFYINVEFSEVKMQYFTSPKHVQVINFLFGLVMGLSIGRLLYIARLKKRGPFIELQV